VKPVRAIVVAFCLALLVETSPGIGVEELSKRAQKFLGSARRIARSRELSENHRKSLAKSMDGLPDDELRRVIDLLRLTADERANSLPAVVGVLEQEHYGRLYGSEPFRKIENLGERLRKEEPAEQEALIAHALGLEDLRLARDLVIDGTRNGAQNVRVRAAIAIGHLRNYGVDDEALRKALERGLIDEDAGVRAGALRAAFGSRYDPVFLWAVSHLEDDEKGMVGEETLRPGEEALLLLGELTRIQQDMNYREYLRLSHKEKASLLKFQRAWWKEKGETFPPPGFREGAFRPKASVEKAIIVKKGKVQGTFQFWSGLDRTRIRLHVDEIEAVPFTLHDWEVNFHLRYMAQGMRMDDGEGYRRHLPMGSRYVLSRKASGCYVLVFQALVEGRVKIRLSFHDPVR